MSKDMLRLTPLAKGEVRSVLRLRTNRTPRKFVQNVTSSAFPLTISLPLLPSFNFILKYIEKARYLGQMPVMQIPAWGTEVNALATALLANRIQSGDHGVGSLGHTVKYAH